MNDTALVPAGQTQIPEDVKAMAGLIRAMLPNGMKISEQEAIAGAMYGKAHGLDPFKGEYFIIPGKGVYPGYRGEMKQAGDYYTQTRPLRGDEATEHEIMPGDSARIVEVYQPEMMRQMRVLGMQYQPIIGVGIVRKAEKYTTWKWVNGQRVNLSTPEPIDPPTGRSWSWKAEQRALKDALRHMQGGDTILRETTDDLLREADEQAQAVVGEFRQLTEEEQRAQFATNVAAMRGTKTDDPLGIDDLTTTANGNGNKPAETQQTSAQMFDDLTTASQERAEADKHADSTPKPSIVGTAVAKVRPFAVAHPHWLDKHGNPDIDHIRLSLGKLGFTGRVDGNNADAAFAKLEAHALSKEADAAMTGVGK